MNLRADSRILNTFIKDKNPLMLSGENGFIYKADVNSPEPHLKQVGGVYKSYVTSIGFLKNSEREEYYISSSADSVNIWTQK